MKSLTTKHPAELRIEDVVVRFGGVVAVDGVELAVGPGEIRGIIGPNGAGKTTLLNAVSGLVRASRGSVVFEGTDLLKQPVARRAQLGIGRTFQNSALIDDLSVLENVEVGLFGTSRWTPLEDALMLPRALRGERRARACARHAITDLGMSIDLDAPVETLPLGMRKLVDLARAWASRPRLLLIDEPTAGLTGTETAELEHAIEQVRGRVTIIAIAHHLDFILNLADVVTVLDFGRVVMSGTPSEIRADPRVRDAYMGHDTVDS